MPALPLVGVCNDVFVLVLQASPFHSIASILYGISTMYACEI